MKAEGASDFNVGTHAVELQLPRVGILRHRKIWRDRYWFFVLVLELLFMVYVVFVGR